MERIGHTNVFSPSYKLHTLRGFESEFAAPPDLSGTTLECQYTFSEVCASQAGSATSQPANHTCNHQRASVTAYAAGTGRRRAGAVEGGLPAACLPLHCRLPPHMSVSQSPLLRSSRIHAPLETFMTPFSHHFSKWFCETAHFVASISKGGCFHGTIFRE